MNRVSRSLIAYWISGLSHQRNTFGQIWGVMAHTGPCYWKNQIAAKQRGIETSSRNRIQALDETHLSRPSLTALEHWFLRYGLNKWWTCNFPQRIRAYPSNKSYFVFENTSVRDIILAAIEIRVDIGEKIGFWSRKSDSRTQDPDSVMKNSIFFQT